MAYVFESEVNLWELHPNQLHTLQEIPGNLFCSVTDQLTKFQAVVLQMRRKRNCISNGERTTLSKTSYISTAALCLKENNTDNLLHSQNSQFWTDPLIQ